MLTDIYTEHIQEAAFLYDQRENLLAEPDGTLSYQDEVEQRLHAHIDGLVTGGIKSRPIIDKYLTADDEGEFFAAFYSRLVQDIENTGTLSDSLFIDISRYDFDRALTTALRLQQFCELEATLTGWLHHESDWLKSIALQVLGYKRFPVTVDILRNFLDSDSLLLKTAALKAANRIAPACGRELSYNTLIKGTADNFFLDECFENLFILNEDMAFQLALQYCKSGRYNQTNAAIFLGLGSLPVHHNAILDIIATGQMHRSLTQAAGFSGRFEILKSLLPFIDNPEGSFLFKEASHIMLGTEPPELPLPEDDEKTKPAEKNLLPPCEDIASNGVTGRKNIRYRLGRPITHENEICTLQNMAACYRKWLYLDISRRSGTRFPVEFDDTTRLQKQKGHI